MDNIGEKLRNARELKKLTIKDISKETNINSKFLEAIEAEEFDKIPGETYLIGFLRNYAEFLKLDGDEIIQDYKGHKIGESQTPLEELTKPTSRIAFLSIQNLINRNKKVFYAIVGIVILIFLIWLLSAIFSNDIKTEGDDSTSAIKKEYSSKNNTYSENIRNLTLTDDKGYVLVYKNETVQFLVDNKEVLFRVKDIKENSAVIEILPGNQLETIEIEKPQKISVMDTQREIILTLKGLTENRAKIFVMLGEKIGLENENKEAIEDKNITNIESDSVIAQNRKNLKIIFEAEFIRMTYFELYLDGIQKKKGIIQSGMKERWEANEYVQLKIGNAGGLKATINNKTYSFGLPGQVANKIITWQKDNNNPNLYHIIIKDWK